MSDYSDPNYEGYEARSVQYKDWRDSFVSSEEKEENDNEDVTQNKNNANETTVNNKETDIEYYQRLEFQKKLPLINLDELIPKPTEEEIREQQLNQKEQEEKSQLLQSWLNNYYKEEIQKETYTTEFNWTIASSDEVIEDFIKQFISHSQDKIDSQNEKGGVVLPTKSRNDQHTKLNERIETLREDSETFNKLYERLDNSDEKYYVKIIYGAEKTDKIDQSPAAYIAADKTIYLSGSYGGQGLTQDLFVEEFAHAAQNKILTDAEAEAPALREKFRYDSKAAEKLKVTNKQRLPEKYTIDNSHSFMEVEAKLITYYIQHEAHKNAHGRNTWDMPEPENLFTLYKEKLFNEDQPEIESKERIKGFHTLQNDFEKYYKGIKTSPDSYKSGKVEAEPTLYNQLVK